VVCTWAPVADATRCKSSSATCKQQEGNIILAFKKGVDERNGPSFCETNKQQMCEGIAWRDNTHLPDCRCSVACQPQK
jgi:hypothetical protein